MSENDDAEFGPDIEKFAEEIVASGDDSELRAVVARIRDKHGFEALRSVVRRASETITREVQMALRLHKDFVDVARDEFGDWEANDLGGAMMATRLGVPWPPTDPAIKEMFQLPRK
jgi:hypothetical protein